ncbi:MAG: ROK family protein [Roseiflexaceae bacterium]|nr:ROK family protein [Roseiflexus sp.]MDW8213361.1 ROK family protein [Roseiflexaceae bacterium]
MLDPTPLIQERLAQNRWGLLGGQGCVLGFDVGSYGLRAALVDLSRHTYVSAHREPERETPEELVKGAIDLGNELMAAHGVASSHLVRVGAGFGGPVDVRQGIVLLSPRVPGWERYPLREAFENAFGATCVVDNDANLIALAEATFGVGRDTQHMVYIHLSTGVGAGLVLDGRLYHGATTTAGEIGHAVVGPVDPRRPGERPKTLEEHVSIKGLLNRAAELGLHTNLLSDIFSDHPAARQVVAEAIDILAVRIAQIVALIDPQMVVIGGVVARNGGEAFINAIQERMHMYIGQMVARPVKVVGAVLGPDSVAIGAVALALESMRD